MKVKFLTSVLHDGDQYEAGNTADMSNAAARALIAINAAEQYDPAAAKAAAKAEAEAKAAAELEANKVAAAAVEAAHQAAELAAKQLPAA